MKTWQARIEWETPNGGNASALSTIEASTETVARKRAADLARGCGPLADGTKPTIELTELGAAEGE